MQILVACMHVNKFGVLEQNSLLAFLRWLLFANPVAARCRAHFLSHGCFFFWLAVNCWCELLVWPSWNKWQMFITKGKKIREKNQNPNVFTCSKNHTSSMRQKINVFVLSSFCQEPWKPTYFPPGRPASHCIPHVRGAVSALAPKKSTLVPSYPSRKSPSASRWLEFVIRVVHLACLFWFLHIFMDSPPLFGWCCRNRVTRTWTPLAFWQRNALTEFGTKSQNERQDTGTWLNERTKCASVHIPIGIILALEFQHPQCNGRILPQSYRNFLSMKSELLLETDPFGQTFLKLRRLHTRLVLCVHFFFCQPAALPFVKSAVLLEPHARSAGLNSSREDKPNALVRRSEKFHLFSCEVRNDWPWNCQSIRKWRRNVWTSDWFLDFLSACSLQPSCKVPGVCRRTGMHRMLPQPVRERWSREKVLRM